LFRLHGGLGIELRRRHGGGMKATRLLDLCAPLLAVVGLALFVAERRRPLRPRTDVRRLRTNLAVGTAAALTVRLAVAPAMTWAAGARFGLLHRLPWPLRPLLGFLLLDWTMYLWHRANHRVPALWRFHRAHHSDRELDTSTALRFHAGELVLSVPFRMAQVAAIGVSPAVAVGYEAFMQAAALFHHSNLGLPERTDTSLNAVVVTPRMHGVHHSIRPEEQHSNWSVLFSFWDRLHGTLSQRPFRQPEALGLPKGGEIE
jgi:sterol desaturase/sphingolipid hydroxylase (fatty acid hydroxylase superfamily)